MVKGRDVGFYAPFIFRSILIKSSLCPLWFKICVNPFNLRHLRALNSGMSRLRLLRLRSATTSLDKTATPLECFSVSELH